MAEISGILVLGESINNRLTTGTLELLGAGSALAKDLGQDLSIILIGSGINNLAQEAIAYGANRVYLADDPLLTDYLIDALLTVMENVVTQWMPQVILLQQSQIGRDLAPRLAFRLNSAAVLDCTALAIDQTSKRMTMTKPVYGGNALAMQTCQTDPQIATIRSKTMTPSIRDDSRKGEIINIASGLDSARIRTKVLERKTETGAGIKLEDARVIVTGGRGIGSPEGFKQLEELAYVLKGAVGASRPPCDNKWVADNLQIGLTGKIVSPELYIAVGVSGSSQHLSGCSSAKVIVAINKDAEANIFKVAQFGIVADWKKALPAFTNKVKQLMG